MPLRIYACEKCSTCRKAFRFLDARGLVFHTIPIRERPPRMAGLKRMLKIHRGDVRKLFNTSGREYKRLKLREKLPGLTAAEAVELLAGNGNPVRRPFALAGMRGALGFTETRWKDLLK
jgi:arsenate reductase